MPHGLGSSLVDKTKDSFNHRMHLYSAAALTAGVGMLALAQPAEGSVVITSANITISPGAPVTIDLNKDGIQDFQFSASRGGYDHSFYQTVVVRPLTGGRVVGGNRGSLGPYASALAIGANIGPSAHFSSSPGRQQLLIERSNGFVSGSTQYTLYGKWGNVTNKYLGVKFLIKGAVHFGWVRITMTRTTGTITEYAYETVANKKITTTAAAVGTNEAKVESPASKRGASIGMLAMGVDGLSLWRRD
jgi:hypothetical protein